MATAADSNSPQATQYNLLTTARALFVGLIWAAIMLIVFGFWMRTKHEGGRQLVLSAQVITNLFLLAGVGAAGLAAWQAFTLWFKKETPEQKTATLLKQRDILAYVFLAGGIALIAMAFVLGVAKKPPGGNYGFLPDNFAETFGVLLFGLISLGAGYFLQQPQTGNVSPIQFLVDKVPVLKMSMIVLGAACLCTFGYLFYKNRNDFITWFPELAGLLFMSMLCFGCLLWLNAGQFDEFGIRLFVLVFGGATGVILFLTTMCRAYLWRQDIFLGGSAAWQGDNAWRFWLCAYVLFASLVLMFVSFNLARADIRTHVALRRVMYGYDTIVQGLLLVGILGIFNIVIYALVPFSYDWTKNRGAYALADSSKGLISGLKTETNIFVLLTQNSPTYKDVHNMLDNCQALNPKLKVTYLSPDLEQAQYERLVDTFPSILPENAAQGAGRGVLIVFGPVPTDKDHKTQFSFIAERKLFDVDQMAQRQGKLKISYKGEGEILKELKFLVDKQIKRKIYVLQGNGELDINNDEGNFRRNLYMDFSEVGMKLLVDRLSADNYDVHGLSFNSESLKLPGEKTTNIIFAKEAGPGKKKEIPDDCHTLIVAGESKELKSEILDSIERYMDHGGRMMVFLDLFYNRDTRKMKNSGMETFLKRYGVEVTSDFPLRFTDNPNDDPRNLIATTAKDAKNPLAARFSGRGLIMRLTARIVKPLEGGPPGARYKAETILQLETRRDRATIIESDVRALDDPRRYMLELRENPQKLFAKISQTPVSVAVAVSEEKGEKPRLVVFGDTEFIANIDIANAQRDMNYAFVGSAIEWMSERESIGALPRQSSTFTLEPEKVNYWRMILLPGWLMLVLLVGMGVAIWVVRRR